MPRLVNSSATLAVALAFIACVTWPFFLPGELLHRDMAVVEHFGRIAANFGAGELPARNVPQDAVLSVLPFPVILVKGLLVASASVAAYGGWCLARLGTPQGTTWPAVALAVCNPYVIERLLQGHWSVAVAAWWLPVLVAASLSRRWWLAWLGLWVVSLTPTGLLLGTIAVVVCGAGRRVLTAGIALMLSMPWLVPGIIAAVRSNVSTKAAMDSLAAVTMFAPRAEEAVGTLGSLLSLGGIWNGHAVPDSRHVGFALFGLVLVALAVGGLLRVHRETLVPVVVLAVCGLIIPLVAWLCPQGLAQVIEHVPGAGLLRDSQKFIILVLPLYLVGLGGLRHPLTLGAVALVLLQTPDAARSVSELRPHSDSEINYRLAAEIDGRLTLMPDRDTLVEASGVPTVDPWSKVINKLDSGALTVDGQVIDTPLPRWQHAMDAWKNHDVTRLQQLGVGVVVEDGVIVWQDPAAPRPRVPWILTALWLSAPLWIISGVALIHLGRGGPDRLVPQSGGRSHSTRNQRHKP